MGNALREPTLVYSPHPLLAAAGREFCYSPFLSGETIAQYLERSNVRLGDRPAVLFLDGQRIPREAWATTVPRDGQRLVLRVALDGGDGGDSSKVLRTVLSIAVLVLAQQYGPAVGQMLGISNAAGTAVALVAGTMLVNAVAPLPNPHKPGDGAGESPTYSLAGAANRARPYEPLPLVLGRHRVFPDLGARPYTEFRGGDQYLYMVFNFGLSDMVLSDMRIGDTPLSEFSGVTVEESGSNGVLNGFPADVDSITGAVLTVAAGWVVRTSSTNATALSVDLAGIVFRVDSRGNLREHTVDLEIEYRAVGSGSWLPFLDTPYTTIPTWAPNTFYGPGYYVRPTTPNGHRYRQDLMLYNGNAENLWPEPGTSAATEPSWPVESGRQVNDGNPEAGGIVWTEAGGNLTASHVQLVSSTRSPVRATFRREVASGQYEVRVRRVSPEETDTRKASDVTWATLRTYQADTTAYNGQKRVGLIIRASGQLSGTIDQFNAIAEARCEVWNGSAWVLQHTRNPAWWFRWFARGKTISSRRVFGANLSDSRLDLDAIRAFATWCDSKELTFDGVFDRTLNSAEVLKLIAACGRGAPTWATGKLGVVWDAPDQPSVAVFGMANIKRNTFRVKYNTGKLADEVVLRFVNSDNNWLDETVRRTVPGVTNPERPVEYSLFGCTKQAMAGKAANLLAAAQVWRRREVTWECDLEAAPVQRGNVVTLSHDLTQWGYSGRLVAGRIVENLMLHSADFSNAAWVKLNTASVTGTNVVNLPAVNDGIQQANAAYATANKTYTVQWKLSGTGTVSIELGNGVDQTVVSQITLTGTPTVYSITHTFNATVGTIVTRLRRITGDTATSVTAAHAQVERNSVAGFYIATTTTVQFRPFLTLDREVPFDIGATNYIGIVFPNGHYDVFDVQAETPGEYDQVVLTEAWPTQDPGGATLYTPDADPGHPPYDYKYLFDPKATPGKRVKIIAVQPLDANYLRLTATDEDPEYYASESDPYQYTPPGAFTPDLPTITTLEIRDTLIQVGAGFATMITLTWDVTGEYGSASILTARHGDIPVPIGRSFERTFQFQAPADGVMDIEVVARSPSGRTQAAGRKRVTYVIVGKDKRPANVTWFTGAQNGPLVVLRWGRIEDVDEAGYDVRYGPRPTTTWANGIPLTETEKGNEVTSAAVPPGDWRFMIKAKDTSGNYSEMEASFDLVVTNALDTIAQYEQAPDWVGPLANGVRHWTGVWIADSTKLASEHTIAELFEQRVPYPVTQAVYELPEVDIGFDDTVRIWGNIDSALLPGVENGVADPDLELDYRLAAGTYDGYESWTIGERDGRFFKLRLVLTPQEGNAKVSGCFVTVDQQEDTEEREATIAPGGSTVTFLNPFHKVPTVSASPKGTSPLFVVPGQATTTGCPFHVYNTSGVSVGGTIVYRATGV